MNIHTTVPHHIFCESHVLVKILSKNMFMLMFIKDLHGGIHMHKFLGRWHFLGYCKQREETVIK